MNANLRKTSAQNILNLAGTTIAVGAVLTQFARFLFIAVSRIAFPFTLEWMEGGSYVQVSRILAGEPLYVKPSIEFVPQIYPPTYFYLSALTSKLLGPGFLPLRLVSTLATLSILIIIFALVRNQTGSKLGGLIASGLFCATYSLSGHWFDIARVDSLALAFLLLSIFLLLRNRPLASILGGLFLVISVFTKQTMLIGGVILFVYCILPPRKNNYIFLGVAAVGFLGGTLLLDHLHNGWYSYYIFHLPGRHSIPDVVEVFSSTSNILFIEIIKPILFPSLIGLGYLLFFPGKQKFPGDNNPNHEIVDDAWKRLAVWTLVITSGLFAIASLILLASLPSDTGGRVVGPFSLSRLLLMSGPALLGILVLILSVWMKSDRSRITTFAYRLFGDVRTVPRIIMGSVALAIPLIILLAYLWPDLLDSLSTAHWQRLSPYLIGPILMPILLAISWRLLWPAKRLETWLYLLMGPGLVAISWLGRLNPGGYYNVFMPAHISIAILFGLGTGTVLNNQQGNTSSGRITIRILVLLAASTQLFVLLQPLSTQIPTQADREAGMEFVSRIKACPGNVYVPFHTYLAELAGKDAYAGVVEMGELKGTFGGRADPQWKEVLSQIQSKLETQEFAIVIHSNQPFREVMAPNYIAAGRVFEDELVFWPITGKKIRPETVYQPISGESCIIESK